MSMRKVFSTIFGLTVLATTVALANAQVTEQTAREQASNVVRSELHSRLSFKSDQFLSIHRDEELEESLAMVTVGWRSGSVFIYKVSPTGVEVKENAIVNHVATDADLMCIVAVSSADGSAYRIHGFGRAESVAEFERLITALKVRVASPDQAESLAEFYRDGEPGEPRRLSPNFKANGTQAGRRAAMSKRCEVIRCRREGVYCLVESCGVAILGAPVPTESCPAWERLSG